MPIDITAAVVREKSGPFSIERLQIEDPRPDELLVEVVASGMCATDLHGRDGYYTTPYPAVFGHEGAGIVRATGAKVTKFKAGDHIVMSYPSCGVCPNCRANMKMYCVDAFPLKMNGVRKDGSTIHSQNGKPVYSAFFQQSSFATYSLCTSGNVVRVPDGLLAPARALTANIALELGYAGDGHRAALFVGGLVLTVLVAALVLAARRMGCAVRHA